ncbi:MAG: PKD domain-containing protein [Cyclobacteriaceae bacterium]
MKKIIIGFWLLAVVWTAHAQNCGAERFYQSGGKPCAAQIDAVKCINLDITDSFDFDGLEMQFIWDMGDGQEENGLEIQHCYDKAGRYTASLTVVDEVTKVVMKDELLVDVYIRGEFSLVMTQPNVMAGEAFSPEYELLHPENYEVKSYYWSYGDGRFSCDSLPEITYSSANKFPLVFNVELINQTDLVYLCQQMEIEARMPDPTGGGLEAYFEGLKSDSRFLEDPAQYQIMRESETGIEMISSIDDIEAGDNHYLLVFKGNRLMKSEPFTVDPSATNLDKNTALQTAANSALEQKPDNLLPVLFELNTSEFSKKMKKTLDKNIEVLKEYEFLQVMIGCYTHTGGSYSRNLSLSVDRSQLIKSYLVAGGIEESRLLLGDPSVHRSLINTCVTQGCDYEDENLNRRADFKILGLNSDQ